MKLKTNVEERKRRVLNTYPKGFCAGARADPPPAVPLPVVLMGTSATTPPLAGSYFGSPEILEFPAQAQIP